MIPSLSEIEEYVVSRLPEKYDEFLAKDGYLAADIPKEFWNWLSGANHRCPGLFD